MSVWTRALARPSFLIKGASTDERRLRALALVLEGNLEEYERSADALALPKLIESGPVSDPLGRLISIWLSIVRGHSEETRSLAELVRTPEMDPEIRSIAAILTGIQLAAGGQPEGAVEVLGLVLNDDVHPLTATLVQLHLGLRSFEAGRLTDAIDHTSAAMRKLSGHRDADSRTLGLVAEVNALQFDWIAGKVRQRRHITASESPMLAWIKASGDEALTSYVDEYFETFFDDPHTRTIRFVAEDRIDVALSRALFRSEGIAYRQEIMRLRQTLGQYRLLTQLGEQGPAISSGFEMLRRAGDHKGLKRALSTLREVGPLEVLKNLGGQVARTSWLPGELHADLTILGVTAFTFTREMAVHAFDRLMVALPDLLTRRIGGAWLAEPGMNALAGVLPLVDTGRTNRASSWLREVASADPNPLVHQSMNSVLSELNWPDLSRAERAGWLAFVKAHLAARDDRLFPARVVGIALASSGSKAATTAILEAYEQNPSAWLAPLVIGLPHLRKDAVERLAKTAIDSATGLRRRAHKGSYGLGGPNTGLLLGDAARRFALPRLWNEVERFVFDRAVPVEERIGTVRMLLEQPASVPDSLRERLARGLPSPKMDIPLWGDPEAVDMLNIRLRAVFGKVVPADALAIVLRYANDSSPSARVEAVRAAADLGEAIGSTPIAVILLSLSYDSVPRVRGFAGHGLARLRFEDRNLEAARAARVFDLLREPGEVVPRLVWYGIGDAASSGVLPNAELVDLAPTIAASHLAVSVREAAKSALEHLR